MQPLEILLAVAVSAAVAGALFLAGARVPLISGVAIALGYFLGDIFVEGMPSIPLAETTQWLAWLAPGAALAAYAVRPRVPAGIVRALFSFAVPWLVMGSIEGRGWSFPRGLAWTAGLGAGTFVLWTSLEHLARRRAGASFPLAAWATVVGMSGVLLGSGSLR
ncbi:MAG TPA: hypothetical protein VMT52_20445, partial [Planctomycetota bacterium]|nr:hypothetical protein [Planctomycetota bacterium]